MSSKSFDGDSSDSGQQNSFKKPQTKIPSSFSYRRDSKFSKATTHASTNKSILNKKNKVFVNTLIFSYDSRCLCKSY